MIGTFNIAFSFRKLVLLLLTGYFFSTVKAQDAANRLSDSLMDAETTILINKYLANTDSAETKILELLNLAVQDARRGDYSNQIKKLQITLILEKQIRKACNATFNLNFHMGDLFKDINIPFALHYYKKAIAIGLQSSEPTDRFTVYNILGGLYLNLNEHNNALRSYNEAMKEAVKDGTVGVSSVNNNIGWYYSKIGKNDSAMLYYQRAKSFYKENTSDDDLYANILENIAKVEELEGNYEAALKLYRFNENFAASQGPYHFVNNRINMIRTQSHLNTAGLKESIDSLSKVIDSNLKILDQKSVLGFYKFCFNYFIEKNDRREAIIYNSAYDDLKEQIIKKDLEKANALTNALLNVQSLSFNKEYEFYRLQLQSARETSYKNKIIAGLVLITALLIITFLAVFITKRKKELEIVKNVAMAELKARDLEAKAVQAELKNSRLQVEAEIQKKEAERLQVQNEFEKERLLTKAQLETKDLEKKAMHQELELKKKDLTNVILHYTHVYETNKEMIDRLQEVTNQNDVLNSLKALLQELKSKNQLTERLSSLQKNIDHLNTEFYHKLEHKFPDLTRSEVELCGYILINLSNKEISVLKNIEPASVKMSKTRLRKKFGLSPEDDLFNFIKMV
jgi:DNA-binding CsgD family transcriptional regulator